MDILILKGENLIRKTSKMEMDIGRREFWPEYWILTRIFGDFYPISAELCLSHLSLLDCSEKYLGRNMRGSRTVSKEKKTSHGSDPIITCENQFNARIQYTVVSWHDFEHTLDKCDALFLYGFISPHEDFSPEWVPHLGEERLKVSGLVTFLAAKLLSCQTNCVIE